MATVILDLVSFLSSLLTSGAGCKRAQLGHVSTTLKKKFLHTERAGYIERLGEFRNPLYSYNRDFEGVTRARQSQTRASARSSSASRSNPPGGERAGGRHVILVRL